MHTDVQEALAYCREITRQQAKNFYYAFLCLPRAQREAIYAVYAFCRYCDDIVDEDRPVDTQHDLIDQWRHELEYCYAGKPRHIITQALQHPIERYAIPKVYFDDLLSGVAMDLTVQRYATFADLQQYCYRVASVIGLACLHIFGNAQAHTQTYARHLGLALQLTNIIRDVKEDAERGRIYLPLEDLQAFDYTEADLLHQRYNAAFVALMQFQQQRAVSFYEQAEACVQPGDKADLIAPEIMAGIYRATLRKIIRQRYNVFRRRISVPKTQKVLIALGVLWRIRRQTWRLP